ncbi:EamA family transporter [Nostoc sp. NIES-2111]
MGLLAALIGGGWQVATRRATTGAIAPADLVLLRYGVPTLLWLPVTLRCGLLPKALPWPTLALLVFGAGAPFGLVAISGTLFAPAARMCVLLAGASPLFAAVLAWALWRDRPDAARALGLALVLTGIMLLGARSLGELEEAARLLRKTVCGEAMHCSCWLQRCGRATP